MTKDIKRPKILKPALVLWLYIDQMIAFNEHDIKDYKIKTAYDATRKLIKTLDNTEWNDRVFSKSGMKFTEHLINLLEDKKYDKYPSVKMTQLQQYIHELIREIGRKTGESVLDDSNASYYKKVVLEMK